MADEKVTADDIRKALENYYPLPEWTLAFEVGNGTGSNLKRHADGVALNMYPSRGYEIRGFEIKVSRSDLQHEIAQAAKAEEVCQYCDTWFLVVPKGLTKGVQIPLPWGIIEYNEGKLRIAKQAEKLEGKENLPIQFVAGLLRARERTFHKLFAEKVESEIKLRKENWKKGNAWELERINAENESVSKKLAEVKEKTGIDLLGWSPTSEIIAKLNALNEMYDLKQTLNTLKYMHDSAERVLGDIRGMQNKLAGTNLFPERSGTR